MFLIIIHVFQWTYLHFNEILFSCFYHNSCISNGHYLHLMKYYFMFLSQFMYSNGHYLHFNEILFSCFDHNSCISNGHYLRFNEM